MTLPDIRDPRCGTCGTEYPGSLANALRTGWGYWDGTTVGGSPAEYVICRNCRTETHKRPRRVSEEYDDTPLF